MTQNPIEIIDGCIVTAAKEDKIDVLFHQVNTLGVMGGGVALEIRDEFPDHYEDYLATCDISSSSEFVEEQDLMGAYVVTDIMADEDTDSVKLKICGVFGQRTIKSGMDDYRVHTNYAALFMGIVDVIRYELDYDSDYESEYTVAFPYLIGCGLAGGEWNVVDSYIRTLQDLYPKLKFVYYKYTPK